LKTYEVEYIRRIKTKFGEALIADLSVEDDSFNVFLPIRYVKISDDDLNIINEGGVYMKYLGGKFHNLDFH
jgi:hypothetical protein